MQCSGKFQLADLHVRFNLGLLELSSGCRIKGSTKVGVI